MLRWIFAINVGFRNRSSWRKVGLCWYLEGVSDTSLEGKAKERFLVEGRVISKKGRKSAKKYRLGGKEETKVVREHYHDKLQDLNLTSRDLQERNHMIRLCRKVSLIPAWSREGRRASLTMHRLFRALLQWCNLVGSDEAYKKAMTVTTKSIEINFCRERRKIQKWLTGVWVKWFNTVIQSQNIEQEEQFSKNVKTEEILEEFCWLIGCKSWQNIMLNITVIKSPLYSRKNR